MIFTVPADDAKALMVFSDSFKKSYPDATVLTISEKNGSFAINSSDGNLGKEVFAELVAISGGKGGGQAVIRGTMPAEKIADVIEGLKRKFT